MPKICLTKARLLHSQPERGQGIKHEGERMMVQLESLIPCGRIVEWRRQKQDRCPGDARNSRAIAFLAALEAEVASLNGSPVHKRLVKLWETEERRSGERDVFSEIVTEALRAVGFISFPANAKELLETIANGLESRDTANRIPWIGRGGGRERNSSMRRFRSW